MTATILLFKPKTKRIFMDTTQTLAYEGAAYLTISLAFTAVMWIVAWDVVRDFRSKR